MQNRNRIHFLLLIVFLFTFLSFVSFSKGKWINNFIGEIREFLNGFKNETPISKIFQSSREVPVVRNVDIIVVGGGPAGVAATLAAARHGCSVLLIEKNNFLGGVGSAGEISIWMSTVGVDSIFNEVKARLNQIGGLSGNAFDPNLYKYVLHQMVKEHPNVEVFYNTLAVGAVVDNNTIKGVVIQNKNGRQIVAGKIVIDCTGDADIAALAGVPCRVGRENKDEYNEPDAPLTADTKVQGLTTAVRLRYVGFDATLPEEIVPYKYSADSELPQGGATIWSMPNGQVGFNCTQVYGHGHEVKDLTELELEARKQAISVVYYYQTKKGYRHYALVSIAPSIGIRETRRIIGEYVLTENDLLSGKSFEDCIAICNYYIDVHSVDSNRSGGLSRWVPTYDIPFRCLVPLQIENLIVAGRCISGTHIAMGSYRIQPTCYALGHAAGTAAALAVKNNIRPRDFILPPLAQNQYLYALQSTLREEGQILSYARDTSPDNIALACNGATAIACCNYSGYAPMAAIDGDWSSRGSRWISADTTVHPFPHWLIVSFKTTYPFYRIELYTGQYANETQFFLRSYSLQFWNLLQNTWSTLTTVSGNTVKDPYYVFSTVTSNKVRLLVTDGSIGSPNVARVYEIRVLKP